ncbi:MAG: hypothetical protein JXR76_30610 [Deltaproteobacteria bacterium]|nr:hypothetical protein [Deltaproteobacteria bacterium]
MTQYEGEERRKHTCFVTHNREYHVCAGVCMAVRDRKSSVWIAGHKAVGLRLRAIPPGSGYLGRTLEFYSHEKQMLVRTSAVVDIMRPNKNQVAFYGFVHGFSPDQFEEEKAVG